MADPTFALETALFSTLSGGTALTGALGGTAIYNRIAPETQSPPYVIFQWQGGGDENMTPNRTRRLRYTVRAVAENLDQAGTIAGHVDTLLHQQTLTVTGWANFWLAREQDVAYVEIDAAGQPVYHTGGVYEIRIDQT